MIKLTTDGRAARPYPCFCRSPAQNRTIKALRPAAAEQGYDEEDEEDNETNLGNSGGGAGNDAKAQHASEQRDD